METKFIFSMMLISVAAILTSTFLSSNAITVDKDKRVETKQTIEGDAEVIQRLDRFRGDPGLIMDFGGCHIKATWDKGGMDDSMPEAGETVPSRIDADAKGRVETYPEGRCKPDMADAQPGGSKSDASPAPTRDSGPSGSLSDW